MTASLRVLEPLESNLPNLDIGNAIWTIKEAAAYLRLSTSEVYKMVRRKDERRVTHFRLGKGLRSPLRFRKSDIDAWLEKRCRN